MNRLSMQQPQQLQLASCLFLRASYSAICFGLSRSFFSLCIALLLGITTTDSLAHSSSNSYLTLFQDQNHYLLRTDIHIRDVDQSLDLDANRDGQAIWDEVVQKKSQILDWTQSGIRIHHQGQPCKLQARDMQASRYADGFYTSTMWIVNCPNLTPPSQNIDLQLTYGLIFDRDALHRGLLKVELPNLQSSFILSPDRPIAKASAASNSALDILILYITEGIWHIWIGADHILFLLSLLVLAPLLPQKKPVTYWQPAQYIWPAMKDVLAVVTAFTFAHSITLSLSVLQWVQPPVVYVESAIALSVIFAAINNLLGWFSFKRWQLALFFGLIHGFGFANVLIDLGLPTKELALALGGFNLGVEFGQLAIVLVFFPVSWLLRHTYFYRWGIVIAGSVGVALIGSYWFSSRIGLF